MLAPLTDARTRSPSTVRIMKLLIRTGDNTALITLFAVGALIGGLFAFENSWLFFYQNFLTETVSWGCGRGFYYLADKPAALVDFLLGRASQFNCAALNGLPSSGAAGTFAPVELYLAVIIAALWRVFGISYHTLWPLVALLHGAYVAGCFALARLWCRRAVAIGVAIVLALSPATIAALFLVRDYSKAPFFVWCLTLLFLSVRAERLAKAAQLAAGAGLVLGIGLGFRADLMILLAVGIILLAIGGDAALRPLRNRAAVIAAFAIVALGSASPILLANRSGAFGGLVMEGMTDPFVRLLGVRPGPYDLGWAYSDELVYSSVTADLRPADPGWDANEPAAYHGVSQSNQRSTGYFLHWAGNFAGDFATHALKAAAWIVGYPALLQRTYALDPGAPFIPNVWFGKLLSPVYRLLAQPVLPWFGGLGLVCLLLHVFTRSPRQALGLAAVLAILLSYPAIQFSIRHVFHLEILFWLALVFLIRLPFCWREAIGASPRFAIWLGGGGVLVAATYASLLWDQDRALPRLIADLVAAPREAMGISDAAGADGTTLVTIPLPEGYRDLVSGPSDSFTPAIALIDINWQVRAAADRLLITVGGAECPAGVFSLRFVYKKSPDVWQPFDHAMTVLAPSNPEARTLVIAPAFYRPTQYLEALSLPAGRAHCIDRIERIKKTSPLPALFAAVLPPGWQRLHWHQGYGSFSLGGR